MIVKVCGMRDADNIREVESLDEFAILIGFIFYPQSPRYVDKVPDYLPERCNRVGVFVDADIMDIKRHIAEYVLDFVQLHGNESPEFCERLLNDDEVPSYLGIIKTIQVSTVDDLKQAEAYEGVVAYFLFETKCDSHGGSGKQFDWSVLQHYNGNTHFLITGGIGPEDAEKVRAFKHPKFVGIDLNSRFETSPAMKSVEKLRKFLSEL